MAGCFEGGGPRTQLPVRVHELCMRPLHLRARRGLGFVHAVAQAVEPRLQLLGALGGETALRSRKFGIGLRSLRISNGLVRLPPLLHQLALEIPLSASIAATFSVSLWLLLSAADFSRTTSACCARRRSTSAANSAVRAPDATWSAKSAACHKNP